MPQQAFMTTEGETLRHAGRSAPCEISAMPGV
jgi:hypothetical protein